MDDIRLDIGCYQYSSFRSDRLPQPQFEPVVGRCTDWPIGWPACEPGQRSLHFWGLPLASLIGILALDIWNNTVIPYHFGSAILPLGRSANQWIGYWADLPIGIVAYRILISPYDIGLIQD